MLISTLDSGVKLMTWSVAPSLLIRQTKLLQRNRSHSFARALSTPTTQAFCHTNQGFNQVGLLGHFTKHMGELL